MIKLSLPATVTNRERGCIQPDVVQQEVLSVTCLVFLPKFSTPNLIMGEGETDKSRYWDVVLRLFKNVSVMKKTGMFSIKGS